MAPNSEELHILRGCLEYIQFAQSVLFEMKYDVKSGQVAESAIPRGGEYQAKDPGDIDDRVVRDKVLAAQQFEKRVF